MEENVSSILISQKIHLIRGMRVILDFDLAPLYGITTKSLKRAVRRNIKRFPEDFMFELTAEEFGNLERKNGPINEKNLEKHGGARYMPFAFSESGVAMLSSVLNSEIAIQVNIAIMRTFIELRQSNQYPSDLLSKVQNLELRVSNVELHLSTKVEFSGSRYLPSKDRVIFGADSLKIQSKVTSIQQKTSQYFGLKHVEILSNDRNKRVALARHIAIYLTKNLTGMSFKEIAVFFGKRDHSTVIHAYQKIKALALEEDEVKEIIRILNEAIRSEMSK